MNSSRLSRLLASFAFVIASAFAWVSPAHAIFGIGDIKFQPPTPEQTQELERQSMLYKQQMAEFRLKLHKEKYHYINMVVEEPQGTRFFMPPKSRSEMMSTIDDYMNEALLLGEAVPQRFVDYRLKLSEQTFYISRSNFMTVTLIFCAIIAFAGISLGRRAKRHRSTP